MSQYIPTAISCALLAAGLTLGPVCERGTSRAKSGRCRGSRRQYCRCGACARRSDCGVSTRERRFPVSRPTLGDTWVGSEDTREERKVSAGGWKSPQELIKFADGFE